MVGTTKKILQLSMNTSAKQRKALIWKTVHSRHCLQKYHMFAAEKDILSNTASIS